MLRLSRRAATSSSTRRRAKLTDTEFGEVRLRRSPLAKHVSVRLMPDGQLSATLPRRASLRSLQELIDQSRIELRKMRAGSATQRRTYQHQDKIGQSHRLTVEPVNGLSAARIDFQAQTVRVRLPADWPIDDSAAQNELRRACHKALKREASAYLPRRLRHLADQHGFDYVTTRFGNPKGRWGSYSSHGTISLNIALMNLPLELIDYVLIHELCHSRYPHHQASFWAEVADCFPAYREARRQLRGHNPYL